MKAQDSEGSSARLYMCVGASVCTPGPDLFSPHIYSQEDFTFIMEKLVSVPVIIAKMAAKVLFLLLRGGI